MAARKDFKVIPKEVLYNILHERLEKELQGKVSMQNTKLIYKTVMESIFDVLKAMEHRNKIHLTNWLEAYKVVRKGRKCSPIERTDPVTGEKYTVDYVPARLAVGLSLRKSRAKNELVVRLSDEEAERLIAGENEKDCDGDE